MKFGMMAAAAIAAVGKMDALGNVADVCCGTGARNDRQYYYDRRKINGDPHGQAPMLWCVNLLLARTPHAERAP